MPANQTRQKLIHLHKSISGAPLTTDLNFGEIAVNHSNDRPALYIKNANEVIEFLPATAVTNLSKIYADGLISGLEVTGQIIASESDGVVSIYPTITETNGEIEISGNAITLAKAAKTGKAEDISIDDDEENFTATDVEGALAEIITKIGDSNLTIDGENGELTTGDGLNDVTSSSKVLSVKTKTGDYVTVDSDGVQLDGTKIDTTYATGSTGNLATVKTVKDAIEDLDVSGFQLLDIVTSGAGEDSELIIKGIKEVDGKIELDSPTNDLAIVVDGKYNLSTNKIATEQTVIDAISGLNVTAVTGTSSQTITSISESNGKISVEYSPISITTDQITDLGDLSQTYAPLSVTGDVSTISGNVNTLIGNDTGKTVRTIAAEELAAQLIPEDAQESLDTLQEIADWIQSHPDDASAMNSAITALSAVSASTRLTDLETSAHTHENISVLNDIDSTDVSNWDDASTKAHEHSNKALLDTYQQTESDLADAVSKKHEHSNATVLNGIDATKVSNWNDAYASAHTHDNMDVLTGITSQKVSDWDEAAVSAHTHDNIDVLTGITSQKVSNWDEAAASAHTHDNMDVLTGITSQKVSDWDEAATSAHTHDNMDVLTGITSQKVSDWDDAASNAVTGATGDTYVSATVTDNEVNVAATTAATNVFTNAVLGVDTTSSATSANVTVDSTSKLLDFSNLSIDCGEY